VKKEGTFIGLLNLVYQFCKEEYGVDMQEEYKKAKEDAEYKASKLADNIKFFDILSKRAKGTDHNYRFKILIFLLGEIPTIAHWIRSFVLKHPKYQKDSIVSAVIITSLVFLSKILIIGNCNRFNQCNECNFRRRETISRLYVNF